MKRNLLSITAVLAFAACNTTTTDGIYDDDPIGRLAGQVTDMNGQPLEGVGVNAGDLSAVTGADGTYLIDGVLPGDNLVVEFVLPGFAKNYQRAQLHSWETVGVDATLTEIDGFGFFDASAGGLIEVGDVAVDFDAGSIVDAAGNAFNGEVRVEITYLDPSTDDMKFAPGDLTALAFNRSNPDAKEAEEPAQLVSYGMADVSLYDENGDPLNVAEGSTAGVDFVVQNKDLDGNPLPDVYAIGAGDEQQTWSFDPTRGSWVEEGVGTVYNEMETIYEERDVTEEQDIIDDDPESATYGDVIGTETVVVGTEMVAVGEQETGRIRFSFEAEHFSWWNCDQGFVPSCATGRVVDMLGFPVRSAKLTAAGGQSTSTVYTDEDGYYVVSVMVGDTVNFTGSTQVGGRSWSDSSGGVFLYGYGSSSADCQPIEEIEIEVCRESGIVMTDNLEMHISGMESGQNGDQLRAWFWEPDGDPANCTNPWEELAEDECYVSNPKDYPEQFAPREVGLASNTRSVGDWLEMRTTRDTYHMNQDDIDGNPVYMFETIEVQPGDTDLITNDVDLRAGDVIRGQAPGSSNDYFGPIVNEEWMVIPEDVVLTNIAGPQGAISRSGGMDVRFEGQNNPDSMVVLVTSDPDEDGLLCKYADDGSIDLTAGDLGNLSPGWTSVSVYRPDFEWTTGPDGLPIRLQAFSGAVIEAELR
jgi:hypothetical protein